MKLRFAPFLAASFFIAGAPAAFAQTYTYSGARNAMNQAEAPTASYDTVEWNITSGYFGTSGARSQTYGNTDLIFNNVSQNNGWSEAVTRFSSATTVTGAGAFSLTNAGLGQDYVFAGNMQGYTGNLSIADFGNATTALGNTGSSVVQYGGETAGGNTAAGTVATDGSGNWINNVAGSGSLTLNNVVFNYGTHAAYDYVKVTNAISQRDSVNFTGDAHVLASGVISGGGSLTKSGAGTLSLTGGNTFSGNTTVNAGTLDLTGGSLHTSAYTSSSVVTINTGAAVKVGNFGWGSTTGFGRLADYAHTRVINGGTLEVTAGSHSSGQDFTIGDNGGAFRYNPSNPADTLVLTGNTNSNITLNGAANFDAVGHIDISGVSAVIAGTGSLTKTGAGTLTLGATTTYTGDTHVNVGTLMVNGSITSTTAVAAGATLGGSGSINGNLTVAGTHAAGNNLGVQTVNGDISYGSSSIFEWQLFSNTDDAGDRGDALIGYDGVNLGGQNRMVSVDSGALFKIALGGTTDAIGGAFWQNNHVWDVFSFTDTGGSVAEGFQSFQVFDDGTEVTDFADYGSFVFSGGNLHWTTIPEPSTPLGGLLIGAGLLCRRRRVRD